MASSPDRHFSSDMSGRCGGSEAEGRLEVVTMMSWSLLETRATTRALLIALTRTSSTSYAIIHKQRFCLLFSEIFNSPFVIMAFKRKRSDAAFSSPAGPMTTSFAQFNDCHSTMPLFFPQSKPGDTTRLETSRNWKIGTEEESSHLNSRTRKRYRDNRPDEAQVHGTFLLTGDMAGQ